MKYQHLWKITTALWHALSFHSVLFLILLCLCRQSLVLQLMTAFLQRNHRLSCYVCESHLKFITCNLLLLFSICIEQIGVYLAKVFYAKSLFYYIPQSQFSTVVLVGLYFSTSGDNGNVLF